MAKEKFNWKALFVNEEDRSGEKGPNRSESKSRATSFPEESKTSTKFPEPVNRPAPDNGIVDNNVLGTVVEMYEAGFESLNQPGYDFYEFFKAIKAVNNNDASVYKMAFTIARFDRRIDPLSAQIRRKPVKSRFL